MTNLVLDCVTYILFCMLAFSAVGIVPTPGAPVNRYRYGYGLFGLITFIVFIAHLFGMFK